MKKAGVEIGGIYGATVSGARVRVKITGVSRFGGWDAINEVTGRTIRIRSAGRLKSLMPRKLKPMPCGFEREGTTLAVREAHYRDCTEKTCISTGARVKALRATGEKTVVTDEKGV